MWWINVCGTFTFRVTNIGLEPPVGPTGHVYCVCEKKYIVNYLGSVLTNGRCTVEINAGLLLAKAAFNKKSAEE